MGSNDQTLLIAIRFLMKEYKRKHTIMAIRSRKTRIHNNKAKAGLSKIILLRLKMSLKDGLKILF